jgi:hypothetical protein
MRIIKNFASKAVDSAPEVDSSQEDLETLVENKAVDSAPEVDVELKPLTSFKTKDKLEEYGKEFGIDLNKSKTLKNMYSDLVEFVEAK